METYRFVRPAQAGDCCLLLLPTESELARLRAYQSALQTALGGQIVEHVHVTCQRFEPDRPEQLQQIIDRLVDELATSHPFPLLASALVTLQSDFWQSRLARWQVKETADWQTLDTSIRRVLQKLGCQPHYFGDKMPTCSALEHIPAGMKQSEVVEVPYPKVLFEARQVVISRIDSPGRFTTLKTTYLGQGIPEES